MIVIHKITDEGEVISVEQFDEDLEGTLTEIFIPKEDDHPSGGDKQD